MYIFAPSRLFTQQHLWGLTPTNLWQQGGLFCPTNRANEKILQFWCCEMSGGGGIIYRWLQPIWGDKRHNTAEPNGFNRQNSTSGQLFSPVQQVNDLDWVKVPAARVLPPFTAIFTTSEEASDLALLFNPHFLLLLPFPSSPGQHGR